ncbi:MULTISPECIES: PAS domain-containing sensor histidine kinase [Microbacterium]|jgi:signal transduction histidine kinase|uniref:sensor histidine kinase n=1 Tax=Microbacterium TaxID=33882 RepID=UPI002782450E|nr:MULTISPECIES: PAS domain-containing sensor histidine kinase [Microbacterium]MDF2919220.1 signal transduction histidine kinase [Microbacterium sp.]MDQ1075522.1 signal transduction histidine kinase [Microbacterium sp. SORGH_AS_0969]MDQ1115761.1 signal transduction histidine kinase [Microbacterium testaceum]
MPLFEMEANPRGRVSVFARAQLPFMLAMVFLVGIAGLAQPSTLTVGVVILGFTLSVLATVLSLAVPWERLPRAWMMLIAALDLLAVALVRAELLPTFPSVSVLAIFPVLWLAYGFPWYGILAGVFGTGFITSFRFIYVGAWPASPVEWANVVIMPTLVVGVAVIVFVAARHLRRRTRQLAQASRAQAEALREARDAEAVALGIVDTVTAGVVFYDADGRLDVANAQAHRFAELGGFRLDEPPMAGDAVFDADRTTPIPLGEQVIPRAFAGEAVNDEFEWWGPADAPVAVLASSSRVRRADGHVLGTVVVIYDVTALAEAIEVREQFLRTVSHELRTPLTSITGFLDLIDDEVDQENTRLRRYVEVVTRRTADLSHRVRDLLAASESEKTLRIERADLGEIVATAVAEVDAFAEARAFVIERAATGPTSARVDPGQVIVAIVELLTNAVKFGIPSAAITVSYGVRDGRALLTVTNDGPGLGRTEQRRAFDRFYRGALAQSSEIQGFGLGLTTVRAIAVAHGGTVGLDSVPGGRTTVTLDLPAG